MIEDGEVQSFVQDSGRNDRTGWLHEASRQTGPMKCDAWRIRLHRPQTPVELRGEQQDSEVLDLMDSQLPVNLA